MATLLLAEHDNKALKDSTNKAMTAAKALGADVHVLVAGSGAKAVADEAAKILGVKSRTEAVRIALREIVALKRFKNLMKKNAGKLSFDGYVE